MIQLKRLLASKKKTIGGLIQKEFGNKENKAKTRQWRMQAALDDEIRDIYSNPYLPKEMKEKNANFRRLAAEDSRILASEGPTVSNYDKTTRRLGNSQEQLLNRSRGFGAYWVKERGVKKVRGAKPATPTKPRDKRDILNNLSEENRKKFIKNRQERLNKPKPEPTNIQSPNPPSPTPTETKPSSPTNKLQNTKPNKVEKSKGLLYRVTDWAKKHPKTSIGAGAGLAILGTGGYLGYQHYKNKKK